MADPVTIVGLAAGIVTFIDFGYKVVSGTRSMRSSISGALPEVAELDTMINDIRIFNDRLINRTAGKAVLSSEEKRLTQMVHESETLYTQLRKTMEKLQVRTSARSAALERQRIVFRYLLSQSELRDLSKRLQVLDQLIRSNLTFMLQSDQHSSVMSQLNAIQDAVSNHGINHDPKIDQMIRDIREITKEQRKRVDDANKNAEQIGQLASLVTKLNCLVNEQKQCSQYIRVIESLYFQEFTHRFDQISDSDHKTNDWIYDNESTFFAKWLEVKDPSEGAYYIYGRAGSGKSTLMKYASQHERTIAGLKNWAGAAPLHIASHFFWSQGTEKQKSLIGLMQSILYQILRSAPDLIPLVCDTQIHHHEEWSLKQLLATLSRVAQQSSMDARFCFFIDGLDEYSGEESGLAQMLTALSASTHIKLCVSSRPGRLYQKSLRKEHFSCDIARYTRDDMRCYVQSRLRGCAEFQELASRDVGCQSLIEDIALNADGVWLWVFLVTRDIISEVQKHEDLKTLRKIVEEFPSDLDHFFRRIISRIKPLHKQEMAEIFLVTLSQSEPITLYAIALLEKEREDSNYAVHLPIQAMSVEERVQNARIYTARLQNRCGDLMIVQQSHFEFNFGATMQFLHRSVRDFLKDSFYDELCSYPRPNFDTNLSMCRIFLASMKLGTVTNGVIELMILFDSLLCHTVTEGKHQSLQPRQHHVFALLDEAEAIYGHNSLVLQDFETLDASCSTRPSNVHSFLNLAVFRGLVEYVHHKLPSLPQHMNAGSIPLLYSSLQAWIKFNSTKGPGSVRIVSGFLEKQKMIQMLINHGADPNESVSGLDGESVWAKYILSLDHELGSSEQDDIYQKPGHLQVYKICELLIRAGAGSDRRTSFVHDRDGRSMSDMLHSIFGDEAAARLEAQIEEKAKERDRQNRSCQVM